MARVAHIRSMIAFADACALLSTATDTNPVSIEVISANREKKVAGTLLRFDKAAKCGLPYSCKDNEMIGVIDLETRKKTAIHWRLLLSINNQEVFWV